MLSRKNGIMRDTLYERIINEIGDREARIIPYLNAEPLLDPGFPVRLAKIRQCCPYSVIEVSSNISLLDERTARSIEPYHIDDFRMSVFGFSESTYRQMMPKLSWETVKGNLDRVVNDTSFRSSIGGIGLVMIDFPLVPDAEKEAAAAYCKSNGLEFNLWGFLDRAGNVANHSNHVLREQVHGCEQNRPLERMHILYDGKVVLCCQDWYATTVLGDANEKSLQDIWLSDRYQRVRESIYGGGHAPRLCSKCALAT
jgi:MoaA/NifB/PqqE/SkfB family radical SAM enzyme